MKKAFFYVAAFAGVLSGCSQNEGEGANTQDANRMPIEIGVTNGTIQTRGIGTVGDTDGSQYNRWAGQSVNVYMFTRGTLELARENNEPTGAVLYENVPFSTPAFSLNTNEGIAYAEDNSVKYYPTSGTYDFVAYRVDGAGQDAAPTLTATACTLPLSIDGTQDVMVADAVLSAEEEAALVAQNPTYLNAERFYSAQSARYNVHPNLKFDHKLARLTFSIEAGNQDCCYQLSDNDIQLGVSVNAIEVESMTTGTLTIAHVVDSRTQAGDIAWDASSRTYLSLKQRQDGDTDRNQELVDLTPIIPTWNATTGEADVISVGEALLVAPDTQYRITLHLSQNVRHTDDRQGNMTYSTKDFEMSDVISLGEGESFQEGHSYNVNVKVFGQEAIDINATLNGWVDGGETIELDPFNNPSLATAGE